MVFFYLIFRNFFIFLMLVFIDFFLSKSVENEFARENVAKIPESRNYGFFVRCGTTYVLNNPIILTWAVNCLQQGIQVKLEPLYQGAFPSPWVLDTWMTGWTGSRLPGAGLGLSRLAGFTSWTIFCGDISVLKFKGKSIRFF